MDGDRELESIEFLAFTIAFTQKEKLIPEIAALLNRWWKGGIVRSRTASALPLRLHKQHKPDRKEVAIFELAAKSRPLLIDVNLEDNYSSLSSMCSQALPRVKFLAVRSRPAGTTEYSIEDFGIFRNGSSNHLRRVWVARSDGGKWLFGQRGEAQPYEEIASYSNRMKRDRLTRDHIVRYLDALGISLAGIASGQGVKHVVSCRER